MKITHVSPSFDTLELFLDKQVTLSEVAGYLTDLYKIASADVTVNLPYLPGSGYLRHNQWFKLEIKKGDKILFSVFSADEISSVFIITNDSCYEEQCLLEQELLRVMQTQAEKIVS